MEAFILESSFTFAAMSELPILHLGKWILMEPMSFLTDAFVAITCVILSDKLASKGGKTTSTYLYRFFFLSIGFSSFFGGMTHLFAYYLNGLEMRVATWVFIGFGVFAMQVVTANNFFPSRAKIPLMIGFTVQFFTYVFMLWEVMHFKVVIINTMIGLLFFVVPVEFLNYRKTKGRESLFIAYGIVLVLFSTIIHVFKLSPHFWFNHNDLAHVITGLCMIVIYKGAAGRLALKPVKSIA